MNADRHTKPRANAVGLGGAIRPATSRPTAPLPSLARLGVRGITEYANALRDGGPVAMPARHAGAPSLVHGGAIRGSGTTTSDSIPIWASKDEFMLPADTAKAVGIDNLQALVDRTHTPVSGAQMKRGVDQRANGGLIEDDTRKPNQPPVDTNAQTASAIVAGAPQPSPSGFHGSAPPAPAAATNGPLPDAVHPAMGGTSSGGAPTGLGAPRPPAGIKYEQTPPTQPMTEDVKAALASGGPLSRNVATPAPSSSAAAPEQGGAAFGIYPNPNSRMSSHANDNALARGVTATGPSTFQPATPAVALEPMRMNSQTDPRSLIATGTEAAGNPTPTQAQVRRVDNATAPSVTGSSSAVAAVPGTSDATSAPRGFPGGAIAPPAVASPAAAPAVGLGAPGYRENPLGSMADTNAQLANLQASNAAVRPGYSGVVANSGAKETADFFVDAENRNALRRAEGAPGGARVQAQRVATAQGAIDATAAGRARSSDAAARNAADLATSSLQESGLAARAKVTDARAAVGDTIARDRVTLEGRKVVLDANRDDRAAAAAVPKLALDARKAELQAIVASPGSTAFQRKLATQALAGMEGREVTGGQAPAGYRDKGNGALEFIPGGPADPAVRGSRAPLNDTQSKALQFGTRMLVSGELLDSLSAAGVNQPGLVKRAADTVGAGAVANWTQSPGQQQVEQAQRDFVNATLRRESGAAISNGEFDNARKQYFPQVGDSQQVIEQKRQNREISRRGILAEVPDSDARVAQVRGIAPKAAPAPAAPRAGQVEDGYTFHGGDPADQRNWSAS